MTTDLIPHTYSVNIQEREGKRIYDTNPFIGDLVKLMGNTELVEFMSKYVKSDLCLKTMFTYMHLYRRIQQYKKKHGDEPIRKDIAAYILYTVMTQRPLRTIALRTEPRPPPRRRRLRRALTNEFSPPDVSS